MLQEEWAESAEAVVKHQSEGWLQPVTSKEYSMSEVPQAHIDIINTKSACGNLIIKTTSE